MATLNTAWSVASSALLADQSALATVANNTANAAIPGYTEEAVTWQQASPIQTPSGFVGSGVIDAGAISQRDRVLNRAIDIQVQEQNATAARLKAMQNLESTFSLSGTSGSASGIGSDLGQLFGAFQQLQSSPSDTSLRSSVLSAASQLADSFNTTSSTLQQQKVSLDGEVNSLVTQVNTLLTSISHLGQQIQSSSPQGADAGGLEDQRQYDLQTLSGLIGTHQITTDNTGLSLSTTGGSALLTGSQINSLTTSQVGGVAHIFDGSTDITQQLTAGGGQLGGNLTARDTDLPNALMSLDQMAYDIGSAVNAGNAAGSDQNGHPGSLIFALSSSVSGTAGTISMAMTDPSLIAAAQTGAGPGDGTNAAALAAIAQAPVVGGQTPDGSFAAFIAELGSQVSGLTATNSAQESSLTQLQNQQTSLSSVNLDHEATSLQNLEQAYQAASKVFTIIDTLLSSAINLGIATPVN